MMARSKLGYERKMKRGKQILEGVKAIASRRSSQPPQ
jgi:hypothetical protein